MFDFSLDIPKKSQFKLNEVSSLTGVKPYVLRFWEEEFEQIAPTNSMTGQKIYDRKDIETILQVKKWLFEKKMTIDECKRELEQNAQNLKVEIDAPEQNHHIDFDFPIDRELPIEQALQVESSLPPLITERLYLNQKQLELLDEKINSMKVFLVKMKGKYSDNV